MFFTSEDEKDRFVARLFFLADTRTCFPAILHSFRVFCLCPLFREIVILIFRKSYVSSFYSEVCEIGGMLQVRVVQGRRVAVMRFATVAFAQSDLTIWYVAIVLPILILATIVTI